MTDITKVKVGPCRVLLYQEPYYDEEIDLGFTKGSVKFRIKSDTKEIFVDQFGGTPINEYIISRIIEVDLPLASSTLRNMGLITPGSRKNAAGDRIDTGPSIGLDLKETASLLVVTPKTSYEGTAEGTDDLTMTIWNAYSTGSFSFAYKFDGEKVFNLRFKGYLSADPFTEFLNVS